MIRLSQRGTPKQVFPNPSPCSRWVASAFAFALLAAGGTSSAQTPGAAGAPPGGQAPPPPPVQAAHAPSAAQPMAAQPGAQPGAPQPTSQPEWTPPQEGNAAGEGNLHDSPLFDPSGETRHFTLTWNPLTLFVMRAELALELMLTDHHVIQLTGFYGSTRTNEVYSPSCAAAGSPHTCANTTLFQGWGGELGYRWYSGIAGPRGLFIAPSFLLADYTATPAIGANTPVQRNGAAIQYWNLGGALDVGWQALVADRFVAGIGGGLQYTVPTHSFPTQELPSSVYANRGLRPRLLITLGVAF